MTSPEIYWDCRIHTFVWCLFTVSGHSGKVPAHSSCSQHEHWWEEEDSVCHHSHQGDFLTFRDAPWVFPCEVVVIVWNVYLLSGCRQTLCPCCPEEGWYWSQQKGWRADWGGGEERYLWPELRINSFGRTAHSSRRSDVNLDTDLVYMTQRDHNSHWAICSVARCWN